MPKIKTKRAAAKRFKKTANGNLKRNKAYKSHILNKKTSKRKPFRFSLGIPKFFGVQRCTLVKIG